MCIRDRPWITQSKKAWFVLQDTGIKLNIYKRWDILLLKAVHIYFMFHVYRSRTRTNSLAFRRIIIQKKILKKIIIREQTFQRKIIIGLRCLGGKCIREEARNQNFRLEFFNSTYISFCLGEGVRYEEMFGKSKTFYTWQFLRIDTVIFQFFFRIKSKTKVFVYIK